MDFVDWCSIVLSKIIGEVRTSLGARNYGVSENTLVRTLFGKEVRGGGDYNSSTYRTALWDAVGELLREGFIEKRSDRHWLPTPRGKQLDKNARLVWETICANKLEPDEERILRVVNRLSPQAGTFPFHSWFVDVKHDLLMEELGVKERRGFLETFLPVTEALADRGLIQRQVLPGYLGLKATYSGLIWETRRRLFQKCDVFISHISEERGTALNLKNLLLKSFGDDLRVFVSSDYESIGGGENWYEEVIESLKAAPIILVLLSETSVESRWVNFEAGVGIGAGRLVIPLVIADFHKRKVDMPLSALQARALYDPGDVEGVIDDIAQNIGRLTAGIESKNLQGM